MGGLDSQIRCFDPLRSDKPAQVLSDHWDNVSVLSSIEGGEERPVFISGSWDKTARVWVWDEELRKWRCESVLKGHGEAVWGVQIVEPPGKGKGRYLTSSADLFIRLFHGEELHAVYAGHSDVVRFLCLLPPPTAPWGSKDGPFYPGEELFASTSNDSTIRIWSLDPRRSPTQGNGGEALRVLKGHTSLVYDLAALGEQRLVSSGEDGTFRVWDWVRGELLQTVNVPVISVWSIAVLTTTQDVAVGCSDGLVRIYSTRPTSQPDSDSQFSGGLLSSSEAAAEAQKAEEVQSTLRAKANTSVTTEEGGVSGEEGEMFEGERYDFVLRIDVADDEEPLPFPINRADDRRKKAEGFVARHQLPESYVERILEFVDLVIGRQS